MLVTWESITDEEGVVKEAILMIDGVSQHIPGTSMGICSYVPFRNLSDHRGVCLYVWCMTNTVDFSELTFNSFEEKEKIKWLFNYMKNPYHITNRITNRFIHN